MHCILLFIVLLNNVIILLYIYYIVSSHSLIALEKMKTEKGNTYNYAVAFERILVWNNK